MHLAAGLQETEFDDGHIDFVIGYPGCRILISLEKMAGIESYVPNRVHTYSTRSGTQI